MNTKAPQNVAMIFKALLLALAMTAACAPGAALEAEAPREPAASVAAVKGTVLLRPAGKYLWNTAGAGSALYPGDAVQARQLSSAIIMVSDNSYVKLMPLSTVVLDEFVTSGRARKKIVSLGRGKAWLMAKEDTGGEAEIILKAGEAVARCVEAAALVETDNAGAACIDLAAGSMSVRSGDAAGPDDILTAGQRILVNPGAARPELILMEDPFSEADAESRTCFPHKPENDRPAVQDAPPAITTVSAEVVEKTTGSGETETYVVLTGATSLQFSTDEAATAQAGEDDAAAQEEEIAQTAAAVTSAAASSADFGFEGDVDSGGTYTTLTLSFPAVTTMTFDSGEDAAGDSGEEAVESIEPVVIADDSYDYDTSETAPETGAEYVTVVITGSSNVQFKSAAASEEEAPPATVTCDQYPEIFDVIVNDYDVDDNSDVLLDSDFPCDLMATATFKFSAVSTCAAVKKVTIGELKKAPFFFSGADEGIPATHQHKYRIEGRKPIEMILKAEDANGLETLFSFTIKLQGQSIAAVPEITDVTVNGFIAKEDSTIDVPSYECGVMPVTISGYSSSECGDIEKLEVEIGGDDMPVRGRDTWTLTNKYSEDTTFIVSLKATDASDRVSNPFEFEVNLARAVEPPVVEVQTAGGEVVSPFGGVMNLYRTCLVDGRLEIKGQATSKHCAITKVEGSNDGGSGWTEADGGNSWTYSFMPRDGEYEVYVRAFDNAGNESGELMSPVEILYSKYTPEEKLIMAFDEMMQAYRDKNSDTFIEYTSPNYSSGYDSIEDYIRLEYALEEKFNEQTTVYLRYQRTSQNVAGGTGRVMFNWDANPGTSGYTHNATFIFTSTSEGWRLLSIEDSDIFLRHTDIAAYLAVASDESSLYANGEDTAYITVEVRDSAYNPVKNGTNVYIQAASGSVESPVATTEGIAESEYTAGSFEGNVTVTATSGGVSGAVTITTIPEPPLGPPDTHPE